MISGKHEQSFLRLAGFAALAALLPACSDDSDAKRDARAVDAGRETAGTGPDAMADAAAALPDGPRLEAGGDVQDGRLDGATPAVDVGPETWPQDGGRADALVAPDAGRDVGPADVPMGNDVPTDAPLGWPSDSADSSLDFAAATLDAVLGADVTQGEDGAPQAGFCAERERIDSSAVDMRCFDFAAATEADAFMPEAGTWVVANGAYEAVGPSEQVTCPNSAGSGMTASVLRDFSATNIRVHARMTTVAGADKVIVLRSRPGGNRIELNFRSNYVYNGQPEGGDLYVGALVNCDGPTFVPAGTVQIPHALGQSIVVDVYLVGQQLTVVVDGTLVLDRILALPAEPGSAGFAVFRDGAARFDDFLVEAL